MNVVRPARISVRTVVPFSFSLKIFSIVFPFLLSRVSTKDNLYYTKS